ncbi:MAG: tetratricopeptide repeat protein [Desulfobacteraceae bacterium]|nr:tetratricopeptide repeat protein [Desulfobacteraceae bacterium]
MEPFEISNSDFTEWDSALLVQHYHKVNSQLNSLRERLADKHELLAESLIYISEKISDHEMKKELLEEATSVLNDYGIELCKLNKYELALEKFGCALQIKPDDFEVLTIYAVALDKLGHHEEAIKKYEHILKVYPEHAGIISNYGIALGNLGSHEEAIKKFEQALKIDPKAIFILNNYGAQLLKTGQYNMAIEKFEQALKIDTGNVWTLINYGATLMTLNQYNAAIEKLEQALKFKHDDVTALTNYASVLVRLGKYETAIEKYGQLLATTPNHTNVLYLYLSLGNIYYRIKSEAQGNKYFELAIEHSDDKDAERIRVAQHIFSVNPYSQDGIDILREITETSPKYSEAFNMLSLNLSLKEYWQMFNTRSDAASLRDNEMLNRAIYHKIKNEISILKDIVYEIISDYQDTDSIFSGIIGNINSVFKGIEHRRNKEKEQVKEFPDDDYEKIIKIISDTAHDISDFVNNELAVTEADIRDILSELSTGESPYQELQELLIQIKITQGALNDLKNINQGIKIRYTRFQIKELFQNWANNRKLQNAIISLDIDNSESVFDGDEQKIKSFLNELVDNSITHNSDKEDLEIRITSKDVINPPEIRGKDIPGEQKFLFIGCSDNGKGIPSDKKKTIFLPLETTSDISSGLGLFIIRRTLHEMNGYIWETGENGANFKIFIPYSNGEIE